mmetsp:Transcript_55413/g.66761  ORF Transcript_55413/g.66761 Transcript_55413/m.66761 type:complete len:156 (+) Transcript_55413:335-802(+)
MSSYGTNSLANGLNAIADAGENQTPQQPDPKPIANARKAGAAEFTRQRIRLQAANSARMLRLNSKRSLLPTGGMSRVGTLTSSADGMISEGKEFVEPEIAEMRMSSKDFQRQQQSLPDNHSSNKENISFSPSLSRLRLKYQPDGPEQRAGKGSSL